MNQLGDNFIGCQFNSIQFQKKLLKLIVFQKKSETLFALFLGPRCETLISFPGTVRRLGIYIDSLALTR